MGYLSNGYFYCAVIASLAYKVLKHKATESAFADSVALSC